jgi:hypothetical protein
MQHHSTSDKSIHLFPEFLTVSFAIEGLSALPHIPLCAG